MLWKKVSSHFFLPVRVFIYLPGWLKILSSCWVFNNIIRIRVIVSCTYQAFPGKWCITWPVDNFFLHFRHFFPELHYWIISDSVCWVLCFRNINYLDKGISELYNYYLFALLLFQDLSLHQNFPFIFFLYSYSVSESFHIFFLFFPLPFFGLFFVFGTLPIFLAL